MRQSWTDDRLDDFRAETARRFGEVDMRFDKVDKRFDKVEGEIKDLRTEMNARFDSMNERFDSIAARLESMQRVMLQFAGALIVALIGLAISQVWFMVTQV